MAALLAAAPAQAAEVSPTAQARAADAAWLPYAPPPPRPVAVCLVDTGADRTIDTQGALVDRLALDGGPPDDADPVVHHGTRMAMIMASAINGTGMIGAWPALRIVSVRAASPPGPGGQTTYRFDDYRRAVTLCWHESDPVVPIVVVELAIGGHAVPTTEESSALAGEVQTAHSAGISVVAGAGNDAGPVNVPARMPGVFAVGAADGAGALCGFSSRGAGLDLLAPGCDLDTVDPVSLEPETPTPGTGGTSEASAFAAVSLAALRAYQPALTWDAAEQLLQRTASDGVVDLGATFRAAGLGDVVAAAAAAMPTNPHPTPTPPMPTTPDAPASAAVVASAVARRALPRARVSRATWRAHTLTVVLRSRPGMTAVHVTLYRRQGRRIKRAFSLTRTASALKIHLTKRPARVTVNYVDVSGGLRPDGPITTIARFRLR